MCSGEPMISVHWLINRLFVLHIPTYNSTRYSEQNTLGDVTGLTSPFHHLPGRTEQNHEQYQSGHPKSGLNFETVGYWGGNTNANSWAQAAGGWNICHRPLGPDGRRRTETQRVWITEGRLQSASLFSAPFIRNSTAFILQSCINVHWHAQLDNRDHKHQMC